MRTARAVMVALVVSLMAACAVGPKPPPAPPRQAALGLSLSTFTLSNGLRVVVVHDPHATDVKVTTRYAVGAADDPEGQAGMAHLVEHLMFQQQLGSQSLFAQLETSATEFNGETTYDATTYTARAATGKLDKLLAIEATRVGFRCTSISDQQFLRERDVVLNEVRQRDQATELFGALHAGLFVDGHPYRHAVAGTLATVGAISFTDACRFADAHYATPNAALVVSGNLTREAVATSLGKFMGKIAARNVPARGPIPRPAAPGDPVKVPAPIDDPAAMFVWALPSDPMLATRAAALVPAVVAAIDSQVAGRVTAVRLGGVRAPLLGILVERADDESTFSLFDAVRTAVNDLLPAGLRTGSQALFGELAFDNVQQSAIYRLYESLEDGSARDTELAAHVLAGRDPSEALAAQFRGLREMTASNLLDLERTVFAYEHAYVIELTATEHAFGSRSVSLVRATHDVGPRREQPDPALARAPAVAAEEPPPAGVRTRTLPNGLQVVLLPVSSVPIVEIRLIFGAGTADEPGNTRGAALLAGYALGWDLHHLNDILRFVGAGGQQDVDVGTDRTTFTVRGVDMHLDLLMAGLRRWVRDGTYALGGDVAVAALRKAGKIQDDDGALTDAWRAAIYGPQHPYTQAGLTRFASPRLVLSDAEAFRAAHYAPDNATLVIAGHFDAALADQWIDFLFADWNGHAAPQVSASAGAPKEPSAVGLVRDATLMAVRLAWPARAGTRAQQLVAAQMLDMIANDVRHRLGAAYSIDAALAEERRATNYYVSGLVDASRAVDAVGLLRTELERLGTDDDAVARAFVTARARVLVHLRATAGSARTVAGRVEHDIELGRTPLSDLETERAVRALTLDTMRPVLSDLALEHATVLLRGAQAPLVKTFSVLGRVPQLVSAPAAGQDAEDPSAPVLTSHAPPRITADDLEDALTSDETPVGRGTLALSLSAGYMFGRYYIDDPRVHVQCCDGVGVALHVGWRWDAARSLGLHLGLGSTTGHYTIDFLSQEHTVHGQPVDIAASFQVTEFRRLFASLYLGMHLDHLTTVLPDMPEASPIEWHKSLGLGLQLGSDLLILGRHRVGVYGLIQGVLGDDTGFAALTLGASYRL